MLPGMFGKILKKNMHPGKFKKTGSLENACEILKKHPPLKMLGKIKKNMLPGTYSHMFLMEYMLVQKTEVVPGIKAYS